MKKISTIKILAIIIILSALIRILGGLIFLKEIPKTYGWYRIAESVIAGEKTSYTTNYSVDSGKKVLTAKYYLVRPPIYVMFYVILIKYFEGSLLSYLIFQSIFSAISIFVTFMLFGKFLSEKVALIGSAMVAFYPYFVTRVWNSCEDNLFILFVLISFHLILSFIESNKFKYLVLSGITLGLTYLIRSTILFFVLLLIPILIFLLKKRKMLGTFAFSLAFVIPLIPWLFYSYSIYGQFVMADHNGSRFWVANNKYIYSLYPKTAIDRIEGTMWNDLSYQDYLELKDKGQLEREKILLGKAINFMAKNPWLFIRSGLKKAFSALSLKYNPESAEKNMKIRDLFHFIFYLPIVFFGFIGIIFFGKKYRIQSLVFVAYYLSLVLMSFFLWAHTRHTIPYHLGFLYGFLILIEHYKMFWPFKCFNV